MIKAMELTNKYLQLVNGSEGCKEFWDTYTAEKQKGLFDLFKGQLIIEKEVVLEKRVDDIMRDILDSELSQKIEKALDPEFARIFHTWYSWDDSTLTEEELNCKAIKNFLDDVIMYTRILATNQTFRRDYNFIHPITNKAVKIQVGSKISKLLKHFISDEKKLNEVQVLYSQILNDKMLKGILCLSIHPLDYLTASVNDSGWESCYNTLDKGAWCASTLSLVTSPNTFVAYLKSKNDANYGWGDNDITWNNKKWRALVTLNKNNELIHIGRNYPYEHLPVMDMIKDMASELTGKTYEDERITGSRDINIITPYNMYNDASGKSIYSYMTEKYRLCLPVYGRENIFVSEVGSVCPTCGDHYSNCEFDILCGNCGDHETCECCGEVISPDCSYWVESMQGRVCESCIEDFYYCDDCNEYHKQEDIISVGNRWSERWGHYDTDYVCRWCVENSSSIQECEVCGEHIREDGLREDGTCYCCEPIGVPESF